MPINNTRFGNYSADVVGIFDQNFNQILVGARPVKANVNEQSKIMEHPVEDGTIITDNRILLPNEIELSMILSSAEYRSVYQQIKQVYTAGTLVIVQTKTGSYTNMVIVTMPHEEDPAMYDTIAVALKLKEVQFVTPIFGKLPPTKVKKKTNASTQARGEVQPQPVATPLALAILEHYSLTSPRAPE